MPVFSSLTALVAPTAFSGLRGGVGFEKKLRFCTKASKKGESSTLTANSDKKAGSRRQKKSIDPDETSVGVKDNASRKRSESKETKSSATPGKKDDEKLGSSEAAVSGAYVPTQSRGEKFMEEQKARDQAWAQKQLAKIERKKKREKTQVKLKSLEACCYGCGAPLQYSDEGSPGYIDEETYMVKKKHHQLKKSVLCSRCQLMCHGKLIPAVGGYGIYGREKGFVTAEELRAQLAHIREERVLVLKLVDIVDFSGSFITRVRDLVGANPIILVATKVDLLPEETDFAAVGDWIVETTLRKKLNVISVHMTSAKCSMGITNIVKEIQRERQGRDVYILGAANVGKSAFINALLKEMASREPVAAAARRYRPVQSVLPGTTVGPISIDAFSSGGSMFDTPGVHLHHRIETAISPDDLPALFPARRLRGYVVSPILERKGQESLFDDALQDAEKISNAQDLSGMSLFWGGIARVDVLKAPRNTRLTFYASSALKVHKVVTKEAEEFYSRELGKTLVPPSGDERASAWPGLDHRNKYSLEYDDTRPVGDIAISGLGWMTMEFLKSDTSAAEEEEVEEQGEEGKGSLEVEVRVPKGIEVFLRPAIPVGGNTRSWYSFTELTEEQEKTRPRLYYSNYREK